MEWMAQMGFISMSFCCSNQLCYIGVKAVTSIYTCRRSGSKKPNRKATSSTMTPLCKAGRRAVFLSETLKGQMIRHFHARKKHLSSPGREILMTQPLQKGRTLGRQMSSPRLLKEICISSWCTSFPVEPDSEERLMRKEMQSRQASGKITHQLPSGLGYSFKGPFNQTSDLHVFPSCCRYSLGAFKYNPDCSPTKPWVDAFENLILVYQSCQKLQLL